MAEYEELDIDIRKDEVRFRVDQADYQGEPDFGEDALEHLAYLLHSPEQSWEAYGAALFRATFRGGALDGYHYVKQAVGSRGRRFRVRLQIHRSETDLHSLLWECLYDPGPPPRRLGCIISTPLSRYLRLGATREPVQMDTLKVLVAISNPEDLGEEGGGWGHLSKLDEEAECATIRESLGGVDRIEVYFQNEPASLAEIHSRLYHGDFHVLHVVGHGGFLVENGREKGYLLLERDEDEKVDAVGEEALADMVSNLPQLQLVVLASCYSAKRSQANAFVGLAPRMIQYGVPAVVAMQEQVTEETARRFTKSFYGALLNSPQTQGMVDAAVNAARDELFFRLHRKAPWDWTIPVLFMRGDGKLFSPGPVVAARDAATSPYREQQQLLDDTLPRLTPSQLVQLLAQLAFQQAQSPSMDQLDVRQAQFDKTANLRTGQVFQPGIGAPKSHTAQYTGPAPGSAARKGVGR
jgi:hypothetical protein